MKWSMSEWQELSNRDRATCSKQWRERCFTGLKTGRYTKHYATPSDAIVRMLSARFSDVDDSNWNEILDLPTNLLSAAYEPGADGFDAFIDMIKSKGRSRSKQTV